MSKIELAKGVYWVGAIDWNLRFCGSYNTPRGTTYNAYLIVDEKITLIDTVKGVFFDEMFSRIKEIVDPSKIDYVVVQHAELDHSGALPQLMKHVQGAQIVCSQAAGQTMREHFHEEWNIKAVKTGDELKLGERTLRFIEAAMLHWPDNMFSYLAEDRILFSNDAFGAHLATHQRYSDEVGDALREEAANYYAVIVSPYASFVQKKLKEVEGLRIAIDMIAPAHGLVWRQPKEIIEAYGRWSSGQTLKKAVIVFDTMWKSTEKMAGAIAAGIMAEGAGVSVFNARESLWSTVIKEIMESRLILVGSPTLNMGMYPSVAGFLSFLKGMRFTGKKAAAFGSYGWAKAATKEISEALQAMKYEILESRECKYVPTGEQLQECFAYGRKLAEGL